MEDSKALDTTCPVDTVIRRPLPRETDRSRPLPLWSSLWLDAMAHVPVEDLGASRWHRAKLLAGVALRSPGFHVMVSYRLAHTLAHRAGLPGRALAAMLFSWNRFVYTCSFASTSRLHGGLILPHPQGIVIGADVVVGPRAWIFQNVTMGGSPGKIGMPTIGTDARIYSGAVIVGPVTVGDHVVIGANAVVHRDVPSRTLVRAPAVEHVPLPQPLPSA